LSWAPGLTRWGVGSHLVKICTSMISSSKLPFLFHRIWPDWSWRERSYSWGGEASQFENDSACPPSWSLIIR
jgi:hypothetical protein